MKMTDEQWIELFKKGPKTLRGEIDSLRTVLQELITACEEEFGAESMADFGDDVAVGGGTDGDMKITFGMIRRGRAALKEHAA